MDNVIFTETQGYVKRACVFNADETDTSGNWTDTWA